MRTITQILIDADKAKNLDELSSLWDEICVNINYYTRTQINYCMEHIANKAKELSNGDVDALKELIDILNSHEL